MSHQKNHCTEEDHGAGDKTAFAGDGFRRVRILGRVFFRRAVFLQLFVEDEIKIDYHNNQGYNCNQSGVLDEIHKGKS